MIAQQAILNARVESAEKLMADHEDRVRALEQWRWSAPTATIIALASAAAAILGTIHH